MTENERFTIKLQDDLFGVVDNYSADEVCVINGIRTEIEAKWLCKDMNALHEKNVQLKKENKQLKEENKELKSELQRIYDVATINKTREIVDSIYDELLYETSEESGYKREIILKCLEKIDDFRDDVE